MRGELTYSGGVRAIVEASTVDTEKVRRIVVAGERGTLVFDELAEAGRVEQFGASHATSSGAAFDALEALPSAVYSFPTEKPLAAELRHFIDRVIGGGALQCDVVDGWRTVGVLDGAPEPASDNDQGRRHRSAPPAEQPAVQLTRC